MLIQGFFKTFQNYKHHTSTRSPPKQLGCKLWNSPPCRPSGNGGDTTSVPPFLSCSGRIKLKEDFLNNFRRHCFKGFRKNIKEPWCWGLQSLQWNFLEDILGFIEPWCWIYTNNWRVNRVALFRCFDALMHSFWDRLGSNSRGTR